MAIPAEIKGFVFDGVSSEMLSGFLHFADKLKAGTADLGVDYYRIDITTQYTLEVVNDRLIMKFTIPISSDETISNIAVKDTIELDVSNEVLFWCAKKLHDKAIRAKLVNDSLEGLE